MVGSLTCPICGDVIGIYEPLLVLGPGSPRPSSLAKEPLLASSDGRIVHRGCATAVAEIAEGTRESAQITPASE